MAEIRTNPDFYLCHLLYQRIAISEKISSYKLMSRCTDLPIEAAYTSSMQIPITINGYCEHWRSEIPFFYTNNKMKSAEINKNICDIATDAFRDTQVLFKYLYASYAVD